MRSSNSSNLRYPDSCIYPAYSFWTNTTLISVLDNAPILLGCNYCISYLPSPLFHIVFFFFPNIENVRKELNNDNFIKFRNGLKKFF